MMRTRTSGFSVMELVVIVGVIGLVGFLGYTFYTKQQTEVATAPATSQSPTVATVPAAPEINTADDLTAAEHTLDSTAGANSNDSTQLDSEFASF
jgi:hypothetical protein